ncbi:MAG: NUDIX hydrolase [Pseudomonadota bacterium]
MHINAPKSPRLAVRALILHQNRLLLVNAWGGGVTDLWTAPGGGVERGASLPENLAREVHEETGLEIDVGAPCLVNEFHDPKGTFHQVDIYFRASVARGFLSEDWKDPEGVVTKRRFFARDEMREVRVKPDSLASVAWDEKVIYDPLEPIVR